MIIEVVFLQTYKVYALKTCKKMLIVIFYSKIAAIPGKIFPSNISSIAPPPVET